MGQYYYGVILDRETGAIKGARYEGKLTESTTNDFLLYCNALSKDGGYYKQRVLWAGDYSKNLNQQNKNIYDQTYIKILDFYASGDKNQDRNTLSL